MKRKIIQLAEMLNNWTSEQIEALVIQDSESNTLYSGQTIYDMLSEYSDRFMICDEYTGFFTKWQMYINYKLPDFLKAYAAAYSNYNPLENYSKHESGVEAIVDGDTTHTHTPDAEHNTKTTATSYDYTTENIQDGTNKPTTEHYVSTFDGVEKLESKNISQGKTTTNNKTNNDTEQTVTDDLKYTDTESHTTITATTYSGDTVTADDVTQHDLTRKGNIGTLTTQQMIDSSLDLARKSLIRNFVQDFFAIYTFYTGGGDCYDLVSL